MDFLSFDNPKKSQKPIYTRSGWEIPVPAEQPLPLPEEIIGFSKMFAQRYFVKIRSLASDYSYNCVGMVFASRRAFIDIQHVYDILREDHYRNISMSNVDIGDVVVYERNGLPEHVGIIIEIDRKTFGTEAEYVILSK